MLDVLKSLLGRSPAGVVRVPGAITDDARVLALATADLADLVFHAPLLSGLRRRWPGASLDVLIPQELAALVGPGGLAGEAVVYAPKQLSPWRPAYASLLRNLGRTRYDVALVTSLSPQPLLETAALASGARVRAGCGHPDADPQLNLVVRAAEPARGYRGDLPRRLAPYLGLDPAELTPGWPLAPERVRQAAQLVHFHKPNKDELLIGIDPALGRSGQAPAPELLHQLAREIAGQVACRILPLSGPGDPERMRRFEALLGDVPSGLARDSVLDVLLLLGQCDLFVAPNTDLFHVAVAHGVPTIGLFAPDEDPRWWPPPDSTAHVVTVAPGERLESAGVLAKVASIAGGRGAKVRVRPASPASPAAPAAIPPGGG